MNYEIVLQSEIELPHWLLAKSILLLGNSSMKLIQLKQMQILYNEGASDEDFIIGRKSLDAYLNTKILNDYVRIDVEQDSYINLNRKSTDADSFWGTFQRLHRPLIFYRTSFGYKSLYDYNNSMVFKNVGVNSPTVYRILGEIALDIGLFIGGVHIGNQSTEDVIRNSNKNTNMIIQEQRQITENHKISSLKQDIIMEQNKVLIEQNNRIITLLQSNKIDLEYAEFILKEKKEVEEQLKSSLDKLPLYLKDFKKLENR